MHHSEKAFVRSDEEMNSWYGCIYWHEQKYIKTSMCIGFVLGVPLITPLLFIILFVIDLYAAAQPVFCREDMNDYYFNCFGLPAGQFLPVRGMIMGILEDLPQLAVQCWVFSTKKEGSEEFSTGALLVAFGMTLLSLAHQFYGLWKRSILLEGTDLSVWRSLGLLFGFLRGNREISKVYAKLILDSKYPDTAIAINGWLVGDEGCKELVDSIERYHHHHHRLPTSRHQGIDYINFACNEIGNDGASRIARAMINGVPFRGMNLAYNEIDDVGLAHLIAAMKDPKCKLENLTLDNNDGITHIGYTALLDGMQNSPKMETLNVTKCDASACLSGLGDKVNFNT
jgi:hypothetical protein